MSADPEVEHKECGPFRLTADKQWQCTVCKKVHPMLVTKVASELLRLTAKEAQ